MVVKLGSNLAICSHWASGRSLGCRDYEAQDKSWNQRSGDIDANRSIHGVLVGLKRAQEGIQWSDFADASNLHPDHEDDWTRKDCSMAANSVALDSVYD